MKLIYNYNYANPKVVIYPSPSYGGNLGLDFNR